MDTDNNDQERAPGNEVPLANEGVESARLNLPPSDASPLRAPMEARTSNGLEPIGEEVQALARRLTTTPQPHPERESRDREAYERDMARLTGSRSPKLPRPMSVCRQHQSGEREASPTAGTSREDESRYDRIDAANAVRLGAAQGFAYIRLALKRFDLDSIPKMILITICQAGERFRISIPTIAARAGCAEPTVSRKLNELEEGGFIERKRGFGTPGGAHNCPNEYKLYYPKGEIVRDSRSGRWKALADQ